MTNFFSDLTTIELIYFSLRTKRRARASNWKWSSQRTYFLFFRLAEMTEDNICETKKVWKWNREKDLFFAYDHAQNTMKKSTRLIN